ncbi:MAG: hypothetical protein R2751_08680 [Bacteroidales bacterium]
MRSRKNLVRCAIVLGMGLSPLLPMTAQQGLHITKMNDSTLYRHHVALFQGFHYGLNTGKIDYSLGLDYEYRGMRWAGIGVTSKWVLTETRRFSAGLPLTFHPFAKQGFSVGIGPQIYFYGNSVEDNDPYPDPSPVPDPEQLTGYHFGLLADMRYKMYLKRFSVALRMGYLRTDINGLFYGVNLGYALSEVFYSE